MREIIFRGKLKAIDKWSYGNLVVKKDGMAIITPDDTPVGTYGVIIPETVGQYTGLKDRNGKMIYEGDIVRCCAGEHYRGTWEFQSTVKIKDIRIIPEDLNYSDVIEVIGNIHENPELVEVEG